MRLPPEVNGTRLDQAIRAAMVDAGHIVSVREVRRALGEGSILVDGRRAAPGSRARGAETIDVLAFRPRSEGVIIPEADSRVRVVFEDAELLVLSKPPGMPTAPLTSGELGTLLGVAVGLAPEIADAGPPLEGGLVHRLDHDTSGVVVFAKTRTRRTELREAFRRHEIEKRYVAITCGAPDGPVVIFGSIAGAPDRRRVRVVLGRGLPARTTVLVNARWADGRALIETTTRTGRRHQIRAHLASIGAPILGDPLYGGATDDALPRVALHAAEVRLSRGETFVVDLADDMRDFLKGLGPHSNSGA